MAVSHNEKIIAFCRVLMAATTVAIAIVNPQQPSYAPELGYVVLASYLLWSALLFWIVRGESALGGGLRVRSRPREGSEISLHVPLALPAGESAA